MPLREGRTTPNELRLHVSLTYAPQNTSAVFDRASGRTPMATGRRLAGGAAQASLKAAEAGRSLAVSDLADVAQRAAGWASRYYSGLGFDLAVKPINLGSGWRLAIDGGEADQKWARILEVGYGPQDTHDFIRSATKKRAIKVRKKGDQPGFYLIVPKVHGKVSRNANGKLTYTPGRDDRLGKWIDPKVLSQFEARPVEADLTQTFDERDPDAYDPEAYPGGLEAARYTGGYNPVGDVDWEKDERGRSRPVYQGQREQAADNPAWVVDRMAQRIRRGGVLVSTPAPTAKKPNATSERYVKTNPSGRPIPNLANRDGARAITALNSRMVGNRVVRTGVNNLRMVALDADYGLPEDNSDQQRIVSRRGDVLSFLTLSTRTPMKPRPGRPAHHVMAQAGRKIDSRIQSLIRAAEQEKREGFSRDAYLEVLRSALGRAL